MRGSESVNHSERRRAPLIVFASADEAGRETLALSTEASALERLALEDISIVFCSSKTRAQVERVQQALGLSHPFLCENGGAVFVPCGYFPFSVPHARGIAGYEALEFGRPYAQVVQTLRCTAEALGIDVVGFSDMSVAEVAAACDLSLMDARLAKLREYDEPFRIHAGDVCASRKRLFKALRSAGLVGTRGRRFEHVGGPVDRTKGMRVLRTLYQRAFGAICSISIQSETALPFWGPSKRSAAGWAEAILTVAREHRRAPC